MEVGIDFGTTFSTLCFSAGRGVDGCVHEASSAYIPTVVGFRPDNTFCIGRGALLEKNLTVYRDIKRWFGCNKYNLAKYKNRLKPTYMVVARDWDVSIGPVVGDPSRVVPVTELAALFIKGLCELAVQLTGVSVQRSVISVPADYNSYKRSYVYRAATAVGVGVQAVVNEPTAAGLSAFTTLSRSQIKYILVYDFGGGTFDASLMVVGNGYICVIDSRGDNYLGGRDIDNALADLICSQLNVPRTMIDEFSMEALKLAANASASVLEHKILLKNDEVKTVKFSRQNLADLALPFISRTLRILVDLLDGRENGSVTAVLVGGSSVLPGVADSVAMLPPIKNVIFERGTYRAAIAIGAAIYAQSFSAAARYRLVDAVSASLSDERRPMLAELILPKAHPIPTKITIPYVMPNHNTAFVLHEGERSAIHLNERSYSAAVTLSNFPKGSQQNQEIEMLEDGRVRVSMGGKLLTNLVEVPPLATTYLSYPFESTEIRYLKPEVIDYFDRWSKLTGKDIAREQIDAREQLYISNGLKSYEHI
uniref:HSP70h n=1 Tax=Manihot esculenta associated ampelovirus 1 TaxID=2843331 RepID=A0A8F0FQ73_9CLOS|nr:HSP70h [Manihot esculenta associated ampelovirus 1]